MFLEFFYALRKNKVPVGTMELLDLLAALQKNLANYSIEDFYYLSRSIFVKNEQYLDYFDEIFAEHFKGIERISDIENEIPIEEDWIRSELERVFSKEEIEMIEAMGGLEELIEQFKKIFEEQDERHEGGNKWIGTGGTSPFGNSGYNPKGFKIGGNQKGKRSAIKNWEKRLFKDYRGDVEINTRNFKLALKRLRNFTREGMEEELNLDETIRKTSQNAGYIDIVMQPEKRNTVKVLLLMDVGGSMDDHIGVCEKLFTAAKAEFKHLKYYYFHNFIYHSVWEDNLMRFDEQTPTWDVIHKYNSDYKLIFVGDATMSPHEVMTTGGGIDYYNKESGAIWFRRLIKHFPNFVWINPSLEGSWRYMTSIEMIKELASDRMYPMTVDGLTDAMKILRDKKRSVQPTL